MSDIKVTYVAINEVYCLLGAYLREGTLAAKYDEEALKEFHQQLHEVLKSGNKKKESGETAVIKEVSVETKE